MWTYFYRIDWLPWSVLFLFFKLPRFGAFFLPHTDHSIARLFVEVPTFWHPCLMSLDLFWSHPMNGKKPLLVTHEPVRVWEIAGWSSNLQENYPSVLEESVEYAPNSIPKDHDMWLVGLGTIIRTTDFAKKIFPDTGATWSETWPEHHLLLIEMGPHNLTEGKMAAKPISIWSYNLLADSTLAQNQQCKTRISLEGLSNWDELITSLQGVRFY